MLPVLLGLDTDVSEVGYLASNIFFVGAAEEVVRYVEELGFGLGFFKGNVHQ